MNRLWRAFIRAGELKERGLRAIMPSRMHFVHYSWPLKPDVCPCDVHFCDYLEERNLRKQSIFHFGTGRHHVIGLRNRDNGLENDIFAITASPGESERYVTEVIRTPSLGRHYKVLFADIYELSAACLPGFDIVTLFHLCEFSDSANRSARMNDAAVLRLLLSKLTPRGRIFFYSGSFAYRQAVPLIEQAVADGRISFEEEYRSLLVYRISSDTATAGSGVPS
jgi:hypothetical protein